MRRASSNQFVEVRTERLEGARVSERRRWSGDFKVEAVAASLEADVNISALARSLDISPSQLFGWRRAAARQATMVAQRTAVETAPDSAKRVEIEIAGAVVRVSADIAQNDLRRVLRAVRAA